MTRRIIFMAVAGLLLQGCGGSTVTTELKNIAEPTRSSLRASGDVTSTLTIESLKIPIRDISLGTGETLSGGAGNANTAYVCDSSSEEGCLVELVGSALQNLLVSGGDNTQEIEAATYTSIMVATCWEEGGYSARIKATASFGGQTWYTKTGAEYMTTNSADYGPVSISFSGCRNYSVLDTPIAIGSEETTLNLFIDLRHIANVSNSSGPFSGGGTNCTVSGVPSGTDPFLCLDYPNVAGSLNSQPTLERYRLVDTSSTASAKIIGLYFDPSSGTPIGGYARDLFDATYFNRSNVFGPFKRAYLSGSNLVVTDYSGGNSGTISGDGNKTFNNFPQSLSVSATQAGVASVDNGGSPTGTTADITRIE